MKPKSSYSSRNRAYRPGGFWRMPWAYKVTLIFSLYLVLSVTTKALPWWFMVWYLLLSLTTYWLYANDKQAAINHLQRTPEFQLQILGLIGGWPGALLAQHQFRHKTIKRRFRLLFWCCVIINLVALMGIHQYQHTVIAIH
ncbi:DUF1294 domain-containing protein [Shewanella yunxiaonensis]|uniref:DUF1294 domain-containing protein n=1 Tax=Shewanella yunxiaonensis TaxID=2829809 RepID=A0ABX7YQN7_9GAMM|nr:DUF1294 domain-containing protein [Shewanella yunxiaonensis]QUN05085.1 DUF1294 domain-containing protein [Shewanella yunxiaonensis]